MKKNRDVRDFSPRFASLVFGAGLCLGSGKIAHVPVFAGEVEETYALAYGAWRQGRPEDAAKGYAYLNTIGVEGPRPAVELALVQKDLGKPEEALALWIKASLLAPSDPFVWNQRGWAYLALRRPKEARESFLKARDLHPSGAHGAESLLGLGMTERLDGNPKEALPHLKSALAKSPYLFPNTALELAESYRQVGSGADAVEVLQRALAHDPSHLGATRLLTDLLEDIGRTKSAWEGNKRLVNLDPLDARARKRMEKLYGYLQGRPEALLMLRRIAWPMGRAPEGLPPSPKLRVRLFADPSQGGLCSVATRFSFMPSQDFRAADLKTGSEITRGKPNQQWEVAYRADNRVIELRDPQRNVLYATKQPFRIEPTGSWGTTLLKSVEFLSFGDVDIGDREFRGALEVTPVPDGFHLLNELALEEHLLSAVADALPMKSPPEAYKAEAVVLRTRALELHSKPGGHFCDSSHCILYRGVQQEDLRTATPAVLATAGMTLSAPAFQHTACGGMTESGVSDRTKAPSATDSIWAFEKGLHEFPPEDLREHASSVVPASWLGWSAMLDAEELSERLKRTHPQVGDLTALTPLRRSKAGRLLSMRAVGTGGEAVLEGEEAISGFLSPRSLRSTLLVLQPLYDGRKLSRLLVWGAGTGGGEGLCLGGSLGLASSGKDFRAILAAYFPGSKVLAPGGDKPPPTRKGRKRRAKR